MIKLFVVVSGAVWLWAAVAGFVLAGIVSLRFGHSIRLHRIAEFVLRSHHIFRVPLPGQDYPDAFEAKREAEEAHYRQQTGIHTGPLMLAVLFFLLAGVALLTILLS